MQPERKQQQFEREKSFAAQLKSASAPERKILYRRLYDQLFEEFPELWPNDPATLQRNARKQARHILPLLSPSAHFVEIGCGTGVLAAELAPHVGHYIGLDVANSTKLKQMPGNVTFTAFDGLDIPLPPASVDIIYSNQVLEHLHTDDARHQCRQIFTILKPGGTLILRTPSRLTGPHDISRLFAHEAEGLHLHEYTLEETQQLLAETGFSPIRKLLAEAGFYLGQAPLPPFLALEKTYRALPSFLQHPLRKIKLADALLNVSLTAGKPAA